MREKRSDVDTTRDRDHVGPGQWPDPFAAECGGPRHQKAAHGSIDLCGPDLVATTRDTGQWNVMFLRREARELYLFGLSHPGSADAGGWVERVDPSTLEPVVASPRLDSGGHSWCGAAMIHANGDVYVANGSYAHRLDGDTLTVVAERPLPADAPHNGIVVLHDGNLLVKDLRVDGTPTTVTVLDPDLDVVDHLVLPESSMGRVAADGSSDCTSIYVPGSEHLHRLLWRDRRLELDPDWSPGYRRPDSGGMAWDVCISGGRVWVLDNGDIPAVRLLHAADPVGADGWTIDAELAWVGPVRLTSVAVDDADDIDLLVPFPTAPGGWVIAPPTHEPDRGLVLVHDTANALLAAYDTTTDPYAPRWSRPVSLWMQPLLFPDAGQLVVNNADRGHDAVEILSLDTGATLARVDLPDTAPNGMFLTPGWADDVYYCTFDTIARIHADHPGA